MTSTIFSHESAWPKNDYVCMPKILNILYANQPFTTDSTVKSIRFNWNWSARMANWRNKTTTFSKVFPYSVYFRHIFFRVFCFQKKKHARLIFNIDSIPNVILAPIFSYTFRFILIAAIQLFELWKCTHPNVVYLYYGIQHHAVE